MVSTDEIFSCDACPSGYGGIMQSWCFHETFPPNTVKRKLHINAIELLTIVVALKLWGKLLRGKKVLIFCDNMSSCSVINKGLSRDDFHQSCLREICFVAATNEFTIKAQDTSGKGNRIANILSRWHLSRNSQCQTEPVSKV